MSYTSIHAAFKRPTPSTSPPFELAAVRQARECRRAQVLEAAKYAFGETAGLLPAWRKQTEEEKKKNKEVERKRINYDPNSVTDLIRARAAIAGVVSNREMAGKTPSTRANEPSEEELSNPNVRYAWEQCMAAAETFVEGYCPEEDCQNFYIRYGKDKEEDGTYTSKPYWAAGRTPRYSYGPFRNPGGGDVKKGDEAYVDIYCGIP